MARKASMWAKAAGEYYRKNKGKNGITLFSDVLKSSDFKREYNAKYGKTSKARGSKKMRSTRRMRGGDITTEEVVPEGEEVVPGEEVVQEGEEVVPKEEIVEGGRRKRKSKSKSKGKKGTKKYFKMW
jgi:flagellar basal body L-ring protein FlgH